MESPAEARKTGSGQLALSHLSGRHRLRLFPPAELSNTVSPSHNKSRPERLKPDGSRNDNPDHRRPSARSRLSPTHQTILMSYVKNAATRNKLSVSEALERLERIVTALQATTVRVNLHDRTPAGELEHILNKLEPLSTAFVEPFKRFDADIESLTSQLKRRDVDIETKLSGVMATITKVLEDGDCGPPTGAKQSEEDLAASLDGAISSLLAEGFDEISEARLGSSDMVDFILMEHEGRLNEHDELMTDVSSWFESTADEMAYTTGTLDDGHALAEAIDSRAFASQQDFDVELMIERGRVAVDALLDSLVASSNQISRIHDEVGQPNARMRRLSLQPSISVHPSTAGQHLLSPSAASTTSFLTP